MDVEFAPACRAYARVVGKRMRASDAAEVLASDGLLPAQALKRSMQGSDFSCALLIKGVPAAIFGVRTRDGVGIVWALTTDVVDRFPIAFWKASKLVLGQLREKYRVLAQCIDARHDKALRWVARLGFDIDKAPHGCGPQRLPFHHVFFGRKA